MPDRPVIAIFADSPARHAYLTDIAQTADLQAVRMDKMPVPHAALILAWETTPSSASQPVLCLGGDPSMATESVRVLKAPVRAGQVIEALHRLIEKHTASPAKFDIAGYVVDTRENLWLAPGEKPIRLTEKEAALLLLLKETAPSSVSRQTLLDKVWAYAEGVETHTLETHIYRLRQKIEEDPSAPKILLTAEDGYRLGG